MKLASQFGIGRGSKAVWAAGILLMLAPCVAPVYRSLMPSRSAHREDSSANLLPAAGLPAMSVTSGHPEVKKYFLYFDGDHSLDAATVIGQPFVGYTKYTVQLHLASGAEQSVVVTAPPGGLEVEMRDMTGDKVPNDVVLRPALLRWFPTVLVNDGHEHFEIVPGTDPSSLSSSEELGSRSRDSQTFALLLSSGFKAVHLPNSRRLSDPRVQECLFSSFTQTVTDRLSHASSPGRAPPIATGI